jgi:hypothetical protein
MTRTHAAILALAVALAAIAGTFAALRTTQLGASARTPSVSQAAVAARAHALDRTERALAAALRHTPPALPKLVQPVAAAAPAAAPAAAAPQRVVYVRPAPVVHVLHRHGEHEDHGERDGGGGGGGDD